MLLVGVLVATPLTVLPFYPDDIIYMLSFLIPAGGSMILGAILCLFGRQDGDGGLEWRSSIQRSSLTVLFAWFWGIFVGAIPFVIGKQLTILQALFESVSGSTTTGLSVMDVTVTPKIFHAVLRRSRVCDDDGHVRIGEAVDELVYRGGAPR